MQTHGVHLLNIYDPLEINLSIFATLENTFIL